MSTGGMTAFSLSITQGSAAQLSPALEFWRPPQSAGVALALCPASAPPQPIDMLLLLASLIASVSQLLMSLTCSIACPLVQQSMDAVRPPADQPLNLLNLQFLLAGKLECGRCVNKVHSRGNLCRCGRFELKCYGCNRT